LARNKSIRRLSAIMVVVLLNMLLLGPMVVAQEDTQGEPPEGDGCLEEMDDNGGGEGEAELGDEEEEVDGAESGSQADPDETCQEDGLSEGNEEDAGQSLPDEEDSDELEDGLETEVFLTSAQAAVIWTDKEDYAPDEWVTIYGAGFEVHEQVIITIVKPDGDVHTLETLTDWEGSFEFHYPPPLMEGLYNVTAADGTSTAETTFTDSSMVVSVSVGTQNPNPVTQGGSATYLITVQGGSKANNVPLSITTALPAGVTAAFDPDKVSWAEGGTATSVLTLTTTGSTPVGSHAFTVRARQSQQDYADGNGTLVVQAAAVEPSIVTHPGDQTITYGGNATFTASATGTPEPSAQWQVSTDGGSSWDNISGATDTTLTLTTPAVSASGYQYRAVFTNVAGTATTNAATLIVNKATATVMLSNLEQTYDASPKSVTVTTNPVGLDVIVTYDGLTTAPTNAGMYAVVATVDDSNYEGSAEGTLVISKKVASVTPDAKSKTYGGADPELTGTLEGFLVGDGVTASYSRTSGETVGTYTINATLSPEGVLDNYDIIYNTAEFEITARPITVTADAKTKVYGEADPELTYQITSGSLAFSDAFTGALERVAGENVGTYEIRKGSLALSSNYDLTYVGANLTITARPITVTADAKTKVYGEADPELTYRITSGNLAFDDEFTGSLAREVGEGVGTYRILRGTLALSSNYNLTFIGADFTIHYGFSGLLSPYVEPPKSFKINSTIPLKWHYTDYAGNVVESSSARPNVRIVRVGAAADGGDLPIDVEDPGTSGLRYDDDTNMWQFNWQTKSQKPGLYIITITSGQSGQVNGSILIQLR